MNTHQMMNKMPKKAVKKVASGERTIFKHNGQDHVTIPFKEYCELLEARQKLKEKRK